MRISRQRWTSLGLLFGLVGPGCTVLSTYAPLSQSNFAYPNSNVLPLHHAEGSASRTYIQPFQIPDFASGAETQDAINQALQASGGDLIIDGSYTMKTTMIYLVAFQIYTVDVTVEGTAAKMEIGKRNLH